MFAADSAVTFAAEAPSMMKEVFLGYLVTFGWAVTASIGMGVGIIVALKMFDLASRDVDEWALVKEGNLPISIILASVILSLGLVVSAAIKVF